MGPLLLCNNRTNWRLLSSSFFLFIPVPFCTLYSYHSLVDIHRSFIHSVEILVHHLPPQGLRSTLMPWSQGSKTTNSTHVEPINSLHPNLNLPFSTHIYWNKLVDVSEIAEHLPKTSRLLGSLRLSRVGRGCGFERGKKEEKAIYSISGSTNIY